ncbi:acyltransferase domain-containing protein [Streptomyces sp. NPDC048161]|jgi:malonyl CoA-acyl carrier protein transacylase|uniref:ACP S-malonyltransferase n=1 Tax=unclassified Streptomyces TaxID=2593676 RepID=UPI00081BAAAB|nr:MULTISPECIES: acyltransferase domain-containing protein [unclassified Streptomyces]SCD85232.1 trans-AT polyketide synthase, acyltransferase and oxidoreductase domain-containing protein [Streptomyces sp. DvalAA-43]
MCGTDIAAWRRPATGADPGGITVFAIFFPGQGAQFRGMGADVFGRYPGMTRFASDLLGYDLVSRCRDNQDDVLSRTECTQPALFTVNALHTFERERREGPPADYCLGHSLGEYNALLAAGVFDFETGLRIVRKRGELMAAASGGGMSAVMNTPAPRLLDLLREDGVEGVDVAAYNTDAQVVIAGGDSALRAAHAALKARGIRFASLRVGAAFHSRHMEPVRSEFESFLKEFTFEEPGTAVISNVTGRPYERGTIPEMLSRQLVEPVRWADSIRYLLSRGTGLEYEEIGGKSLLRMVRSIEKADSREVLSKSGV